MASVLWSRKRHEERLFAEAPDIVAAVFFRCAEDSEILSDVVENPRGRPPNRLNAVVVGRDAVDKVQRVRADRRRSGL